MDIVDFVRAHLHLSDEMLFAYVDNQLDPHIQDGVDKHLASCPACKREVDIWTKIMATPFPVVEEVDDDHYDLEDLIWD
jgi:anti-sigma factor RsiW